MINSMIEFIGNDHSVVGRNTNTRNYQFARERIGIL
jgi:hypothetical protein